MYQIEVKKTYKGKTGGGWIKNAHTQAMNSGDFQIHTPDLPGCELILTNHDNLIISDFDGVLVSLFLSNQAVKKMESLQEDIDNLYKTHKNGY